MKITLVGMGSGTPGSLTVDLTFAPSTLTLNAASTLPAWWQYLVPTWYQTFCLILYPALCASAVSLIRSFFAKKEPKKL